MRALGRAAAVVAVILIAGSSQAAEPSFPPLSGRVVDAADIIPADTEAEIAGKLEALEAKTTDQFVVVTVASLEGYDIQDYGVRLGRAWGIGQKGKDNGLILLVAPNEHKVGFEVGYGLEGTMTDALTQVIIQNAILPRFRANDFAGGIERGVDDAIQVLTGEAPEIQKLADKRQSDGGFWNGLSPFIIFIIIILILRGMGGRRRGGWWILPWLLIGSGGSRRGGGGWRSGGGWSSGGGGFSGGGGSFGGGGSSGSW